MNGFLNSLSYTYDLSLYFLEYAIIAGMAASLMVVIVLALNLLFRRWLTAGQMSLLWGLVLLRLAIPFAPGSDLSLQSAYISITQPETMNVVASYSAQPWPPVDAYHAGDVPQHGIATPYQSSSHSSGTTWSDVLEVAIPFVWLAGFVSILCWTLLSHFRFARKVKTVPKCQDSRILGLWAEACRQAGFVREIPIVVLDHVHQPAVMGVFRPQLLLPCETLSSTDSQLKMVMLHEAAHLKCWDLAINWGMLFVRAVQWWNPIYWIAATRYVNLREQSRDAMVLRWLDEPSEREYSNLLLMLAEQKNVKSWRVVLPASMLGFMPSFFRKRAVANRLKAVKTARKSQYGLQYGFLSCVVAFIAFAGLTDAKTPEPVDPGLEWFSQRAMSGQIGVVVAEDNSPFIEKEYELTTVILNVAESERLSKQAAFEKIEGLLRSLVTVSNSQRSALEQEHHEREGLKLDFQQQGRKTSVTLNGPQSLHAQLEHLIFAWKKSGLGQIVIEARMMTSTNDAAAMAGLEWSSIIMAGGDSSFSTRIKQIQNGDDQPAVSVSSFIEESAPFMTQVLTDAAVRKLIQTAQGDARSNIMFAPKVTLYNGHQAAVFSSVRHPFVVGVEKESDGKLTPKINIIDEGMSLIMNPTLTEDRQAIQMQAQLELSEVTDVSTFTYELEGEDVTVQLPTVRRHKFQAGAKLDDGKTLVIACPPTNGRKEFFYLLLTPRVVTE